jgi:hypothetical protein
VRRPSFIEKLTCFLIIAIFRFNFFNCIHLRIRLDTKQFLPATGLSLRIDLTPDNECNLRVLKSHLLSDKFYAHSRLMPNLDDMPSFGCRDKLNEVAI